MSDHKATIVWSRYGQDFGYKRSGSPACAPLSRPPVRSRRLGHRYVFQKQRSNRRRAEDELPPPELGALAVAPNRPMAARDFSSSISAAGNIYLGGAGIADE